MGFTAIINKKNFVFLWFHIEWVKVNKAISIIWGEVWFCRSRSIMYK
jgi:hypothetical protein